MRGSPAAELCEERCQLLSGNSQGKTSLSFLKLTLLQLGVKLQLKLLEREFLKDKIIKSLLITTEC